MWNILESLLREVLDDLSEKQLNTNEEDIVV